MSLAQRFATLRPHHLPLPLGEGRGEGLLTPTQDLGDPHPNPLPEGEGKEWLHRNQLEEVPGIGVVLIGEGDLSQELGHPREYEHPVVAEAINRILAICQQHNVPCGHPHLDARNTERLIASGYRFLMPSAPRSFSVLEQGRKLAGRS